MQLEFLWWDQETLEDELAQRIGAEIDVVLTDNSSNIMSFKSATALNPARLRVHRMFLSAAPFVLDALSTWMTKRRSHRAAHVLDEFIKAHEHLIQRKNYQQPTVTDATYFDGKVDAPITWGRMPTTRRRRSIRLGSYTPEDHLIRIHPLLDQSFVPVYFVRYIIYHEMLHAHLGVEYTSSGRRRVHTRKFNRMERDYPDYDRATAWHDDPDNLDKLLKAPRKAS